MLDDVMEAVKVKMAYERDTEGLRRFAQLKLRLMEDEPYGAVDVEGIFGPTNLTSLCQSGLVAQAPRVFCRVGLQPKRQHNVRKAFPLAERAAYLPVVPIVHK